MYSKAILLSVLVAIAEARFGQEQVPIEAIQNSEGGNAGDAATLAGSAISTLLAAANPCDKLTKADEIVATLGDGGLEAAKGLVAAEQNFNPFAVSQPTLCSDATLPATEALRGIIPLVDPAVEGAAEQNAASAASLTTPLDAAGLSVADVTSASGFTNFLTKDAAGAAGAAGDAAAGDAAAAAGDAADAGNAADANAGAAASSAAPAATANACGAVAAAPTTLATVTKAAKATKAAGNGAANAGDAQATADAGNANNANNNANAGADDAADNAADNAAGNAGNANNADNANAGNANNANNNADAGADDAADNAADNAAGNAAGNGAAAGGAAAGGALDFGTCDPTIIFEGGLGGRPADEFTFQSNDAVIAANQQEALNPNIITNRICDELTNTCGAAADAVAACESAQADIEALGTRDQTTADAWNTALGF